MTYVDLNPDTGGDLPTGPTGITPAIKPASGLCDGRRPLPPLLLFAIRRTKRDGLPYTFADYLMLVDWTGAPSGVDKRGYIPFVFPHPTARLGWTRIRWLKQVTLFRRQAHQSGG